LSAMQWKSWASDKVSTISLRKEEVKRDQKHHISGFSGRWKDERVVTKKVTKEGEEESR